MSFWVIINILITLSVVRNPIANINNNILKSKPIYFYHHPYSGLCHVFFHSLLAIIKLFQKLWTLSQPQLSPSAPIQNFKQLMWSTFFWSWTKQLILAETINHISWSPIPQWDPHPSVQSYVPFYFDCFPEE